MRTKTYRTASVFCMTLFVTTLIVAEGAGVAWAWRSPPPAYWSGPRLRELPRGYRSVRYGHDSYYFTYGRFYRRGPSGFFLTAPPFGMVVPSLPLGYVSLVLGGITYYELNGIYFRQVPEGYRVVEYPVVVEKNVVVQQPESESGQRIVVQSELLNVRSGPGLEQDIITPISRGNVLKVLGNVPGWYYVELPDGERGWVMEKFTAPLKPVPQG